MDGWEGKSKLAHLVTRLKGQALSYYHSCPLDEKTDYDKLTKALTTRFTLVQLPVVQSALFHERKQKAKEDVDTYAQDLWNLFQKAYPKARQGSKEAEEIGKAVLAHQFAAGLLPDLKVKVAGADGTFQELLSKARLEEAIVMVTVTLHDSVQRKDEEIPKKRLVDLLLEIRHTVYRLL